jgi:hypothetical protein
MLQVYSWEYNMNAPDYNMNAPDYNKKPHARETDPGRDRCWRSLSEVYYETTWLWYMQAQP